VPVWHLSVSAWNQRQQLPRVEWSEELTRRARKLCRKLLREVGAAEFWKAGEMCEHYRKLMTSEEIRMLDPKWLALPAIDEAG